jgi:hypothetical protein
MKDAEDEAFDDIERRQGGFQAKRAAAAGKLQENAPLYASDYERGFIDGMQKQAQSSVDKAVNRIAQPAQEQNKITFRTSSDWVMRITADRRIEVNEGVEVTEAAKKVLETMQWMLKPAQEPVAWAVQGCAKMWRGEFAEIDAKAEAKRIGGTCVAYALYTTPPKRPWVGLTDDEHCDIWYKESLD